MKQQETLSACAKRPFFTANYRLKGLTFSLPHLPLHHFKTTNKCGSQHLLTQQITVGGKVPTLKQ